MRRLAVLLAVVLTIGGGGAALGQPASPGPAGDEREVTRALVHLIRDVNAVKSSLRRYARERAAATGQPVCPVRRGNCLSSAIEAANAAGGDRAARAVLHDAVEDYLIKAGRADLAIAHGDDGWRPYLEELYGGRFSPPLGAGELTPALGVQPEGTIAVVHASGDRARHLLAAVTGPGGGVHFIDANKVDRETDAYGSAWTPRELSAHFDTFRWIDTGRRADLGTDRRRRPASRGPSRPGRAGHRRAARTPVARRRGGHQPPPGRRPLPGARWRPGARSGARHPPRPGWLTRPAGGFRPVSGRAPKRRGGDVPMGTDDKLSNKGEELRGKAKEGVGRATGDEELEAQGRGDQAKADVKQAAEKVKDAFKR